MPAFCRGTRSTKQLRDFTGTGFDPWIGKIPWRREYLPTPVSLLGEFHGQRSLAGYSPWGHKELDSIEGLTLFFSFDYLYFYDVNC